MGFPVLKSKSGALVIIYTCEGGGSQPIHGAYLSRSADANVWIPCSWSVEGYRISKNRPADLDIVEEIPKLKEQSNSPERGVSTGGANEEAPQVAENGI